MVDYHTKFSEKIQVKMCYWIQNLKKQLNSDELDFVFQLPVPNENTSMVTHFIEPECDPIVDCKDQNENLINTWKFWTSGVVFAQYWAKLTALKYLS